MGHVDKHPDMVAWLKRVHNDNNIVTKTFFSPEGFYSLYLGARNKDKSELSSQSFVRLIRSICKTDIYEKN